MALWLNRTAGVAGRNGTTTHTITFASDGDAPFTPTDGRVLAVVTAGAVTMTWPGGWTERLDATNNAELSVATHTAASTTSVTITHNGSDAPIQYAVYEFPAGTAWVASADANAQANDAAQPTVTGLPGTAVLVMYAVAQSIVSPGNPAVTATWTVTENVDSFTDSNGTTDGVWLGIGYEEGVTATSATTTPTLTNGRGSATERATFALDVPTGTVGAVSHTTTASSTSTAARSDAGGVSATSTASGTSTANTSSPGAVTRTTTAAVTATASDTAATRTALTVQSFGSTGGTPTFTSAIAGGHAFACTGRSYLRLRNTSGSAVTVTVHFGVDLDGATVTPKTITVPATTGDVTTAPFPRLYAQRSDGSTWIDYSATSGVTVAAISV